MTMSALILSEPWASSLVDGDKTLELRSTTSRKVGQTIGIIATGTGTVTISGVVGPLTEVELTELADQHLALPEVLAAHPTWRFGWQFQDAVRLQQPIVYTHPPGAQGFVILTPLEALAVQHASRPAGSRGIGGRCGAVRKAPGYVRC